MKSERQKRIALDERGIIGPLLANPLFLIIIAVVLIILLAVAGLVVLFAPNIAAAGLILLVALWLVWKSPIPDPRLRWVLPVILVVVAVIIYLYGDSILAVVA